MLEQRLKVITAGEGQTILIAVPYAKPLTSIGTTILFRGGQHPRMRLIGGHVATISEIISGAAISIETENGVSAATATTNATPGLSNELSLTSSTLFTEWDSVVINVTAAAGVDSQYILVMYFMTEPWSNQNYI